MNVPRILACALLGSTLAACPRKGDGLADASPDASASGVAAPLDAASPRASASAEVITNASPAWDAGPPLAAGGEVDGAALRRRTHARLDRDRSPVTVLTGGTALELGARLCEAVVPPRPKDTPILIKPNISGFEWFKDPDKSGGDDGVHGRVTDAEFVRGIIRCLKARGHTRITVAEGSGSTYENWQRLARVSGYTQMTADEGVPLVTMDDNGVFDVQGDKPGRPLRVTGIEGSHAPTVLLPKILAEHLDRGLFISAPKIKAHRFGVVTMAIKGGQGTVMLSDASPAFRQKWRMHKELAPALELLKTDKEAGKKAYLDALSIFAERMVDQLEIAGPHVVLAEGAPAMGGDGFRKFWPSAESIAVGGENPVLVDRVGAQILGLWDNADLARELGGHKTSPLIEAAAKRFAIDLASPVVKGDGAALLAARRPVHFVSMSGFSLHSDDAPPVTPTAPAGSASPGGARGDAGPADRPTLSAKHVAEGALAVDGTSEPAWAAAPFVAFDTDWSGAKTTTKTRVKSLWSERALYMLWELDGAGLHVDESRPKNVERSKLYEEDCVELFLAPDPAARGRYAELEIGPLGHFFDLWVDRPAKKSDVAWSAAAEIGTKVDRAGGKVTIEVAVRAPEIVRALAPGAKLPLALYRMEGKGPRQFLAWSPTKTPKPDFHVPEAFGTLVLE